jgi:hypothetical protein
MEFDDNTINTDRGLLDGGACVNMDTTLPGEDEEPVIDRAIHHYNSCSREDDDWFEQHPKDSQAGPLLIPSCNEEYSVCNTTSQLLTEGDNSDSQATSSEIFTADDEIFEGGEEEKGPVPVEDSKLKQSSLLPIDNEEPMTKPGPPSDVSDEEPSEEDPNIKPPPAMPVKETVSKKDFSVAMALDLLSNGETLSQRLRRESQETTRPEEEKRYLLNNSRFIDTVVEGGNYGLAVFMAF